jgi:hypothetical protein
MIIGNAPAWSKDNAVLLAQFLSAGTGQLFLAQIAAMRPALLGDSSDVNAVALRGQFVAGYERALNNILTLTTPPETAEKQPDNYPDLDDNAAWEKKEQTPNS